MAKGTGQAGRGGAVKPPEPAKRGYWDPQWEAKSGEGLPAYLITSDGTILDNRKILEGENFKGSWEDSHSAAIRMVARRNGWTNKGYTTLKEHGWIGVGRVWERVSTMAGGRGGMIDVRSTKGNPAAGFKKAQDMLYKLIDLGAVRRDGRFTYAWGLGYSATGWNGEGQWAGSVSDFLRADSFRDLPAG